MYVGCECTKLIGGGAGVGGTRGPKIVFLDGPQNLMFHGVTNHNAKQSYYPMLTDHTEETGPKDIRTIYFRYLKNHVTELISIDL